MKQKRIRISRLDTAGLYRLRAWEDPAGAFQYRLSLAADIGSAEEAKAMLERAVAAVKEDNAKALDMFNKGEGGFKERVFMCVLTPRTEL